MKKKIEKNYVKIVLNVLYAKYIYIYIYIYVYIYIYIYPAYTSKDNSNREKQVIFLIIPNGEGRERSKTLVTRAKSEGRQWHYLAVKNLSALFRRITSKNNGDFYCLNYFHSFRRKSTLESHKKIFENKDFCNVIMSPEDTEILEFNQYQQSDKARFIIYANLESVIEVHLR